MTDRSAPRTPATAGPRVSPPAPSTSTAGGATSGTHTPSTARIQDSGPDTWGVWVPALGTLRLSTAELAYVGGIVIAGGHLLAADRSSRTVRDLGEAMSQA